MKLKTFLATYSLFLIVLFACFGIVSAYMTDTQVNMYMERSSAEYQRIAVSLSRDIAVLYGISHNIAEDITALVNSYMAHYARSNVTLVLYPSDGHISTQVLGNLVNLHEEYFIQVSGNLPEPFGFLRLDYFLNITEAVEEMRGIQNLLLYICIAFAVVTAFVLYFILARIFKPLQSVSQASRKLATGNYSERIPVRGGKNEIAAMAEDFNSMATQIEQQVQALKDEADNKQQFVDNFAHEMRTPLTSIFGYAEYLQKASLSEEEIIESAQYIIDEANHMKNMANSLLTLATLRGYTAVKDSLDISQLFDVLAKSLEKQLEASNVQLMLNNEATAINGKEDLLKSLLLNLCTNALKACPSDGSGVITLAAKKVNGAIDADRALVSDNPTDAGKSTEAGDAIIISVADNGRGIPKESLPKITEPFYRVDKARNREQGGAGLGLALCKRIAEAHGATLEIESTVDVGTVATITFTTL